MKNLHNSIFIFFFSLGTIVSTTLKFASTIFNNNITMIAKKNSTNALMRMEKYYVYFGKTKANDFDVFIFLTNLHLISIITWFRNIFFALHS
jgi:hypothetical protein